jgi:hypothetical protein
MNIQKVNNCGTSKAVVIPKDYFNHWAGKGKTFSEVRVQISDDMETMTIKPIFEDMKKGRKKK